MHEQMRRWLRKFGRLTESEAPNDSMDDFDTRIGEIEQKQRGIEVRLRLLERQADPRGWQQHG